jgi:hypothetical protein
MKLPFVVFVPPVPLATEHPDTVMTVGLVGLEILHDPSSSENPVPFTKTSPPISWLPGLSVIAGLVTVNVGVVPVTESPVLPVTVIV